MKEGSSIYRTGGVYKWCVVAMLSCAFFFHQADRALCGLLTIPIQNDLGLAEVAMGKLSDAYGIFGIEIGFAVLGVTYLLAACVMAISFFFTFRRNRIVE